MKTAKNNEDHSAYLSLLNHSYIINNLYLELMTLEKIIDTIIDGKKTGPCTVCGSKRTRIDHENADIPYCIEHKGSFQDW